MKSEDRLNVGQFVIPQWGEGVRKTGVVVRKATDSNTSCQFSIR
jgi:hypothetical protein